MTHTHTFTSSTEATGPNGAGIGLEISVAVTYRVTKPAAREGAGDGGVVRRALNKAMDAWMAEHGDRLQAHARLDLAPPARVPSQPAMMEIIMPGDMDPVYYPKTRRGIHDAIEFLAGCILDGGAGAVSLNHELLDAWDKVGFGEQVAGLRASARRVIEEARDYAADAMEDSFEWKGAAE